MYEFHTPSGTKNIEHSQSDNVVIPNYIHEKTNIEPGDR